MKKAWSRTILIAILFISLFLRVYHLNEQSLWLDEGVTYYNSSGKNIMDVWDKAANLDQSPPFYYLVMHGYLEIFGENEFGFRFVPVIFGVLSVLFLYLLMALLFNPETGLISAFLLAINPFHIGFSMESRMYVLLGLEALMAFYMLVKAMKAEKSGMIWFFGSAAVSIIGLYTHTFYFFVLLGLVSCFFILLIPAKERLMKFLMGVLSSILILISFLPWIPNLINQLTVDRYWMAPNTFWDLKDYFKNFMNQNEIAIRIIIGLAVFGILYHLFSKKSRLYKNDVYSTFTLLGIFVIATGAPLAYSLIFEPIMKIRYMVYVLPLILGGATLGIYVFRRLHWGFAVLILCGFTYLWMPWNASAYPVEFGEDFRTLVEIVNEDPAPLIAHTPSIAHVINFYNSGNFEVYPFPDSDDLRYYNFGKEAKNSFMKYIDSFDEFYLVVTHSHEDLHGLLRIWSGEKCSNEREIKVSGMEVFKFKGCE